MIFRPVFDIIYPYLPNNISIKLGGWKMSKKELASQIVELVGGWEHNCICT